MAPGTEDKPNVGSPGSSLPRTERIQEKIKAVISSDSTNTPNLPPDTGPYAGREPWLSLGATLTTGSPAACGSTKRLLSQPGAEWRASWRRGHPNKGTGHSRQLGSGVYLCTCVCMSAPYRGAGKSFFSSWVSAGGDEVDPWPLMEFQDWLMVKTDMVLMEVMAQLRSPLTPASWAQGPFLPAP